MQLLSKANLSLTGALMLIVLFAGPTLYLIELFVSSIGVYLQRLPRMSLYLDPGAESEWQTT